MAGGELVIRAPDENQQFHIVTTRETRRRGNREPPADAASGMIRKLTAASTPGHRLVGRAEESRAHRARRNGPRGLSELLMPAVQPAELWKETGRWDDFGISCSNARPGGPRLRVRTDPRGGHHRPRAQRVAQLQAMPVTFYQIQTKFRDEIRPRFGVMRAREFLMKDAYSFHIDEASLDATYWEMYEVYSRIFTRAGLLFRCATRVGGSRRGITCWPIQRT
jgi:prolyl-tRNA synthetase